MPEHGLGLRLETVDLRLVRHVELEAERREVRIADRYLEIPVVVVVGVELRMHMAVEADDLPARLIFGNFLGLERRRDTDTDRDIQPARPEPGRDEGVEEVVLVDGPVE